MVTPQVLLIVLGISAGVWAGDKVVDGTKKAGHAIVHVLKKAVGK